MPCRQTYRELWKSACVECFCFQGTSLTQQEARYQQLLDQFVSLAFLHAELGLPTVPLAQPHHFPVHLLASRASEERPGAHAGYEKILSRYISANSASMAENAEASCKGLEDVEPEIGLLSWAEEINGLVRFRRLIVRNKADL